jgi:hypothetical protein
MSKPVNCISVTEARTLQDNWVKTREAIIERDLGEQDCREVLFKVEDLEAYLKYVKEESAKQGITNPGIRIYFGAYDDAQSKKATVFLAPTLDVNSLPCGNNYAVDPLNKGVTGWPPLNY